MSKQNNQESLTTKLGEMFPADVMSAMLADAGQQAAESCKSYEEELSKLNPEDREKRIEQIQIDALTRALVAQIDKHRRFVHWNRAGYWADKAIQGLVSGGILVAGAAIAMKVAGRPSAENTDETETETTDKAVNPFQTTATERPVRSAREIKTA